MSRRAHGPRRGVVRSPGRRFAGAVRRASAARAGRASRRYRRSKRNCRSVVSSRSAEAIQLAQSRYPGRVVRAQTIQQGNGAVHEIRIIGNDGRVHTVMVDARTGAVH